MYFNPRSPHGERLLLIFPRSSYAIISIHAPRMGSDNLVGQVSSRSKHFNPRSPHGERPASYVHIMHLRYFNPRSPHGERLRVSGLNAQSSYFNPRSPHGERHSLLRKLRVIRQHFNPRSPHGERHFCTELCYNTCIHFNPRSPHGERLLSGILFHDRLIFQSTLPAWGATAKT